MCFDQARIHLWGTKVLFSLPVKASYLPLDLAIYNIILFASLPLTHATHTPILGSSSGHLGSEALLSKSYLNSL